MNSINRRAFLQTSTGGAGLLLLSKLGLEPCSAASSQPNPFAYDVDRFTRTDPTLVKYERELNFPSPVQSPRCVEPGPNANMYVAGENSICMLDVLGKMTGKIETAQPARCLAVDGEGIIYAGIKDHVEVFDPKGRLLSKWDPPDKKTWITGIALIPGGVFAADSGNRVIWRLDSQGKTTGRIAEKSRQREIPGLIVPSPYLDVKLGADGLLRVNNPGRHRVEIYTPDGDLELVWGKPSAAIAGFCGCCNPIALSMLSDGRSITCEKGLPRVKIYGTDGTFECVVAGPEMFPKNAKAGATRNPLDGTIGGLDASADAQGRIWVLDLVAEEIQVFKRKA